jgi:hypothetical protein
LQKVQKAFQTNFLAQPQFHNERPICEAFASFYSGESFIPFGEELAQLYKDLTEILLNLFKQDPSLDLNDSEVNVEEKSDEEWNALAQKCVPYMNNLRSRLCDGLLSLFSLLKKTFPEETLTYQQENFQQSDYNFGVFFALKNLYTVFFEIIKDWRAFFIQTGSIRILDKHQVLNSQAENILRSITQFNEALTSFVQKKRWLLFGEEKERTFAFLEDTDNPDEKRKFVSQKRLKKFLNARIIETQTMAPSALVSRCHSVTTHVFLEIQNNLLKMGLCLQNRAGDKNEASALRSQKIYTFGIEFSRAFSAVVLTLQSLKNAQTQGPCLSESLNPIFLELHTHFHDILEVFSQFAPDFPWTKPANTLICQDNSKNSPGQRPLMEAFSFFIKSFIFFLNQDNVIVEDRRDIRVLEKIAEPMNQFVIVLFEIPEFKDLHFCDGTPCFPAPFFSKKIFEQEALPLKNWAVQKLQHTHSPLYCEPRAHLLYTLIFTCEQLLSLIPTLTADLKIQVISQFFLSFEESLKSFHSHVVHHQTAKSRKDLPIIPQDIYQQWQNSILTLSSQIAKDVNTPLNPHKTWQDFRSIEREDCYVIVSLYSALKEKAILLSQIWTIFPVPPAGSEKLRTVLPLLFQLQTTFADIVSVLESLTFQINSLCHASEIRPLFDQILNAFHFQSEQLNSLAKERSLLPFQATVLNTTQYFNNLLGYPIPGNLHTIQENLMPRNQIRDEIIAINNLQQILRNPNLKKHV